jgi:hypothetical protein
MKTARKPTKTPATLIFLFLLPIFFMVFRCANKDSSSSSDSSSPVACGTKDSGVDEEALAHTPKTTSQSLTFKKNAAGTKWLAVILLSNAQSGQEIQVLGANHGASAYNNGTCPIDQGTNNADTVANSKIAYDGNTANTTKLTVSATGAGANYSVVVTVFGTSDPGTGITFKSSK